MEQNNKRRERILFFVGLVVGVLATVWIYIGVTYVRYFVTINKLKKQAKVQTTLEVDGDEEVSEEKTYEPIMSGAVSAKITTIERMIRQYYYKEVDTKTLRDGLYSGLLESLEDPYSEYYSEEELEQVRQDTKGIYYGIGAYVSIDAETTLPVITGTISGTPAEEAGLQSDDIIYKVDGKETTGLTTTEVVTLIKGEEHTTVMLTLIRDGETIDVEVERRKVESPTVQYHMEGDDIGYIQITEFSDVTTDQFTEAMAVLRGQGMNGLIIDLRSNGGGNLSTCCDIARQILPKGLIVYTKDKFGKGEEYACDGSKEIDVPLVVLVNGYSASASEILTGAVKDYGIGVVMGTKTYGKGIVQQIMSLNDGTAMKVTVSKYFTPNGNYIHEVGIEPDIEVEFDGEAYRKDKTDNQLNAAVDQIKKMME